MGRRKGPSEVFEDGDKAPRNTANARERTRMDKLDTLMLAMSYINQLQRTLEEDDNNGTENKKINVPIMNKVGRSKYFDILIYFVQIYRNAGLSPT